MVNAILTVLEITGKKVFNNQQIYIYFNATTALKGFVKICEIHKIQTSTYM